MTIYLFNQFINYKSIKLWDNYIYFGIIKQCKQYLLLCF